ncbi:lysozyme g-like [Heteronotia binoei]|uniref:lysozyme g-like n=1 Tax=Heteronotia binoei TaxID=13085 RepID=UPI00292EBB60|nr:lysozyme g-like [Heteronotia binoei]
MAGVSLTLVLLFCLLCRTEENSEGSSYGDIMNVETTGASSRTAKAERLGYVGVQASETIAARDLPRMESYRSEIERASESTGMDGAVIAGIISRESHAGSVLRNGWGDRGNGFGLMQVDRRFHVPEGSWNSEALITQGATILRDSVDAVARKFPEWTSEQQLKGGISAYNAGVGNVRTYDRMDSRTTGSDYANDVAARAQYYKRHGF